ncbi:hypothetical protein QE152_g39683 [Popillia japonica]|uniref:Uncharacterized protein n=1 Tax=Popillia japonica TaxID=7064 RepID=A0AAW1HTD1_POPJA
MSADALTKRVAGSEVGSKRRVGGPGKPMDQRVKELTLKRGKLAKNHNAEQEVVDDMDGDSTSANTVRHKAIDNEEEEIYNSTVLQQNHYHCPYHSRL